MLLNLRGPSGSGKSWVGHQLIERFPVTEVLEDGWLKTKPKLMGYDLPGGLRVVGSYRAPGGGMDTFMTNDRSEAARLIRRYAAVREHLFFEALIMSSTVPLYLELDRELGRRIVFAFLDTPPDLCIQRVYQRNGGKPIREDTVRTHAAYLMNKVRPRLESEGCMTVVIDHTRALEHVLSLFRRGGWNG